MTFSHKLKLLHKSRKVFAILILVYFIIVNLKNGWYWCFIRKISKQDLIYKESMVHEGAHCFFVFK